MLELAFYFYEKKICSLNQMEREEEAREKKGERRTKKEKEMEYRRKKEKPSEIIVSNSCLTRTPAKANAFPMV